MTNEDRAASGPSAVGEKLAAISWGLFLIWMGISVLADVGWGPGLLGIGVITIGTQMARKSLGLALERFWLVMGIVFGVWGVWELLGARFAGASAGLLPILCIAVGTVLVTSALLRKPPRRAV